jgi:L-ribulose-5-phosphate 4-epimerase
MLEDLKQRVCRANLQLVAEGLVVQTFGNVSGLDRDGGFVVIKPSGVDYGEMTPEQMVVVSLADGKTVEGDLRPSSDTPTHLELYRSLDGIGGVVHTHSLHATAWAQAQREIPALGTTHADYFHGPVPCTRAMTDEEIRTDYEAHTGKVVVERFAELSCRELPGVLVAHHGPFTWGETPAEAVHNAAILEHLARLAAATLALNPYPRSVSRQLLDKHYLRKHGPGAYYGQQSRTK